MGRVNFNERANTDEIRVAYGTKNGIMFEGMFEEFLKSDAYAKNLGQVALVLTSPPFPLNRQKRYGNKEGEDYISWLTNLAVPITKLLSEDGSIVIEIGNAWIKGKPIMSTLAIETLLAFLKAGTLNLCEQFVCYNPARLPSPAQWVNVERIRVKDAFTNAWWMSTSERPKANNRMVLDNYSKAMKKLLATKKYNAGLRPSEHVIGKKSFLTDNGGAIPSNVLIMSNTESNSIYQRYCRQKHIKPHPARMPEKFADFFIKLLTQPGDLVLDPFAGSNTVGATAEKLGRRWISIEVDKSYILGSIGRFNRKDVTIRRNKKISSE